jgi:dCTP deaminase
MTFSLKNDHWIHSACVDLPDPSSALITPFTAGKIRERESYFAGRFKCVSFGLSSFGYDLSLSGDDFKVFHRVPGLIMDPHEDSSEHLDTVETQYDDYNGAPYFILPAHSYGLGVVKELIQMPPDIMGLCIGKSTYARLGIICNMTPVEPGWRGHLTIELSNSSDSDCRIYADEGICQIIFFQGELCLNPYGEGKYQDQKKEVTHARV